MLYSQRKAKGPKPVDRALSNLKIIIDHAHLSKLRPLTVYCVGKGNLNTVYSYDIIIPKAYKLDQVATSIEENIKKKESEYIEKRKENVLDLLKKLKNFQDENDSLKHTINRADSLATPRSADIDEKLENILSHPLVYSDLTSLVIDLRFKSFLNLELRNVFDQRGDLVNSFADIKRDEKCIFLTDDKTLERKGKELFIFLTWFHTKMYLKEIIPINLLENFRNDGTQILEIDDIFIEGGDLDDGKPDAEGGELDPIKLMNEKLELIRILKKPQRLRLIDPLPMLPEIPKKLKPYMTNSMKSMFSKTSKHNAMIKSKIELEKLRNSKELNNSEGASPVRIKNRRTVTEKSKFSYSALGTFPRNLSTSILDLKKEGLKRLEISKVQNSDAEKRPTLPVLTNSKIVNTLRNESMDFYSDKYRYVKIHR